MVYDLPSDRTEALLQHNDSPDSSYIGHDGVLMAETTGALMSLGTTTMKKADTRALDQHMLMDGAPIASLSSGSSIPSHIGAPDGERR